MDKISVIIPSFNRFKYLLNTIKSIKEQTYKNIEIIVINDKSSQKEYYEYDWHLNNIKIIHLKERSKEIFGYPCVGYVRNQGIKSSSGKYIAFCDDDDIWFPNKIELQLKYMQKSGCKMSCTEGLFENGIYDKNKNYKKFNTEHYYEKIKDIYKNTKFFKNGFPQIWELDFLKIHNCIINSSVIVDKIIL
jgi:teichuronic acid biosynthesis glycosyltransferase TuaG